MFKPRFFVFTALFAFLGVPCLGLADEYYDDEFVGDEDTVFVGTVFAPDSGEAAVEAEESDMEDVGVSCASCRRCCCQPKLFGLIRRSDHCFDDFISPMTNPVFFEDPRTLTELRFFFLDTDMPNNPAPFFGGDYQVWAMQARFALTERLSFIANKDGYIALNPAAAPASNGWADVAAGLKYNLLRDTCRGRLLTAGFTYEIDMGEHQVLQGLGDGEFHFFTSGAMRLGCNTHLMSGAGFRIPTAHNVRSQMFYWSNHIDHCLGNGFYAVAETNWYHWLRSGTNAGTNGVEGGDLINLGSTGVAGNDIVTAAIGGKYKPNRCLEIGVAWEVPVTNRRDFFHDRLTVDVIRRF